MLGKRSQMRSNAVKGQYPRSLPTANFRRLKMNALAEELFYSSAALEHVVPKAKEAAFDRWYHALVQCVEQQPGFLRTDRCPPLECVDDVVKHCSILHFDTPQHLNAWLTSQAHRNLLESGQYTFVDYKFKSFTTGLEGWFSRQGSEPTLGPPRWKQVLSVVLGLYPMVMTQGLVFSAIGLLATWPPAAAMLANNLITAAALSYGIMPRIGKLFSFWLYPAHRDAPKRVDWAGTAILVAALGMMVLIFSQMPIG